jgi:hypothetical protein
MTVIDAQPLAPTTVVADLARVVVTTPGTGQNFLRQLHQECPTLANELKDVIYPNIKSASGT